MNKLALFSSHLVRKGGLNLTIDIACEVLLSVFLLSPRTREYDQKTNLTYCNS